ncbi:MAG: hypothetical protein M3N53_07515 [Actinomycetota bacterium]|nr:hypothetical protein [Actinomycetota bacterium]
MRTRSMVVVVIAGLCAGSVPPAAAHGDVRLSICIPYHVGGECARRSEAPPSYHYGDRVPIKGRARPNHEGAVKIQRRRGARPWRTVARVLLVDGRYRYVWQTTRRDADQDTPYRFRAVLPDHDRSRVQRVYVLFGE